MKLKYTLLTIISISTLTFATDTPKNELLNEELKNSIVQKEIRKVEQIIGDLKDTNLSLLKSFYQNEEEELKALEENVKLNQAPNFFDTVNKIKEKNNFWTEAFYQ